jgi:hypothetical protein
MTSMNQAVTKVKSFVKQYEALSDVIKILEGVSNLEQTFKEAKIATEDAQNEMKKAQEELTEVKKDVWKAKKDRKEAGDEAKRIALDAQKKAQDIVSNATAELALTRDQLQKEIREHSGFKERDRVAHNVQMSKWREEETELVATVKKLRKEMKKRLN